LAGLELALKKYGTRSFREIVQPAIGLARDGFPLGAAAAAIGNAPKQLAADPGSAQLYLRDGKPNTANVAIGDRAKTYADLAGNNDDQDDNPQESDAGQGKLGITVSAIPATVAQKTGISKGVIVTSVRPGSFADEINLAKGTIITEINKKAVTDEASYRAIVTALKPKDDVVFVVHSPFQKGSGNSYVGGTLP